MNPLYLEDLVFLKLSVWREKKYTIFSIAAIITEVIIESIQPYELYKMAFSFRKL